MIMEETPNNCAFNWMFKTYVKDLCIDNISTKFRAKIKELNSTFLKIYTIVA